jgi:hypothetical protein
MVLLSKSTQSHVTGTVNMLHRNYVGQCILSEVYSITHSTSGIGITPVFW